MEEDSPIGLNTALYDAIGPHGTTKFCDAVLKAQLTEKDKENIDFVEAFELLQMTARPGLLKQTNKAADWITDNITHIMERTNKSKTDLELEEIDTVITPDQFISAIKIWKEQTSTSPSGRHLGHYKTIIKDRDIVQYYCTMCILPLQYGFAPER